jgi:hypothetical protein
MRRSAGGWLLAGCVVLILQGAFAANLSASLKNFYTEYEVVKQCQEEAQLSAADADQAKAAMAKIETQYLQRDASIDKDRLLKEAVVNKDEGFRIATRSLKSDLRQYCRVSLKELVAKAEEIDASPTAR